MERTREKFVSDMTAMFDEIKPILRKYNVLEKGSKVRVQTSTLDAAEGDDCGDEPGCHFQDVVVDTGPGQQRIELQCICPGDPRYKKVP